MSKQMVSDDLKHALAGIFANGDKADEYEKVLREMAVEPVFVMEGITRNLMGRWECIARRSFDSLKGNIQGGNPAKNGVALVALMEGIKIDAGIDGGVTALSDETPRQHRPGFEDT